ncbi:MAG: ABC transporter permease [Lachnospiraceae bacterium]|nr:ABC transporter permease [Lachnospiraceae bacterium]
MQKFKSNQKLYIGAFITGIMLLLALTGTVFTPYDPNAMDTTAKFGSISLKHIMGCDNFGRDIFSRVLAGLSTTMSVAMGTVLIGIFFGTLIGAFTGYFGGMPDEILMRINDAVLAFPSLLLALVFISIMGPGKFNVTIALGILFIPGFARIMRGEFLRCKNLDYVQSARLMGASDLRIMFVHILPNTLQVMLSTVAIGFNNAVLAEAGMSFLGIGVQPPDSSLGRMLSEAQTYLFIKPGYAIVTGMTIALLILGFAMLSEGLEKNA